MHIPPKLITVHKDQGTVRRRRRGGGGRVCKAEGKRDIVALGQVQIKGGSVVRDASLGDARQRTTGYRRPSIRRSSREVKAVPLGVGATLIQRAADLVDVVFAAEVSRDLPGDV